MTSSAQRHVLALIASLVVGCEDDELPPLPPPTMTTGVTNAVAVGGGEVDGDTSATTATTDAKGTTSFAQARPPSNIFWSAAEQRNTQLALFTGVCLLLMLAAINVASPQSDTSRVPYVSTIRRSANRVPKAVIV